MKRAAIELWAPLPGWGGSYEVDLKSGRTRSRERYSVNTLGYRRLLRGIELTRCRRAGTVTLSHRGVRRSFTAGRIVAMALAGKA